MLPPFLTSMTCFGARYTYELILREGILGFFRPGSPGNIAR
jgi:hypothetical protein